MEHIHAIALRALSQLLGAHPLPIYDGSSNTTTTEEGEHGVLDSDRCQLSSRTISAVTAREDRGIDGNTGGECHHSPRDRWDGSGVVSSELCSLDAPQKPRGRKPDGKGACASVHRNPFCHSERNACGTATWGANEYADTFALIVRHSRSLLLVVLRISGTLLTFVCHGVRLKPLGAEHLKLPPPPLGDFFAPLRNRAASDFEQLGQRLGVASKGDSVLSFHRSKSLAH